MKIYVTINYTAAFNGCELNLDGLYPTRELAQEASRKKLLASDIDPSEIMISDNRIDASGENGYQIFELEIEDLISQKEAAEDEAAGLGGYIKGYDIYKAA